jgi:hypothetical protein
MPLCYLFFLLDADTDSRDGARSHLRFRKSLFPFLSIKLVRQALKIY